jgi:hypothetical protein
MDNGRSVFADKPSGGLNDDGLVGVARRLADADHRVKAGCVNGGDCSPVLNRTF